MSIEGAKGLLRASGLPPLEIVDVGANPIEGDAPYKAMLDNGLARVTGFEPNAEAFNKLQARKSEAETYLPHALGDGQPATLHLFQHSGFTSLFPIDTTAAQRLGFGKSAEPRGSLQIDTSRLDDLDDVPLASLLKIDVQGAETMIIGNGRNKLSRAMAIWTEVRLVPLYQGEPTFGDLDAELRSQGFMFHDFAFLKRVPLGGRTSRRAMRKRFFRQVVDGDAIYIRDPEGPGIDNAQVVALAVLAAGVLLSAELAFHCADILVRNGALNEADHAAFVAALPAGSVRAEQAL
ncbi:FkbM family methyltransferase [Chachezhania sediminis]|uniref:FkbM family methyltransferase n=1 Tax=Chachezhania sediminis TaxID=2599291 RepID=UPI00131E9BC0|nr:FkbM family methyltransferase [Chachezhania sediminis]